MLVLSRKCGEVVVIDRVIKIMVVKIRGNQVTLGFEAPRVIPIVREELIENALTDTHPDMLYGIAKSHNSPSIEIPLDQISTSFNLVKFFK